MEFWIPLLGGALGAAIINGAFGWWKHLAERRVEHDKWLRDQRQEAYASFLRGVSDAEKLIQTMFVKEEPDIDAIYKALENIKPGMIRLVAPREIVEATDRQYKAVHVLAQTAFPGKFTYYPVGELTVEEAAASSVDARIEYLRLCRIDLYPHSKREEAAATTNPQP